MTKSRPIMERIEELAFRQCEGTISPAEERELHELVKADAAARRHYVLYMQLQALAEAGYGADGNTHVDLPSPQHSQRAISAVLGFFRQPTPLSMSVAALVMGLLLTAMAFMVPPFYRAIMRIDEEGNRPPSFEIVARLTGLHEVEWENETESAHRGAYLVAGRRIALKKGLAEITFDDGAVVVLKGPGEFIVESSSVGALRAGHLSSIVPAPAAGFTVTTPTAEVVDLGTKFIAVVTDEETTVQVEIGRVEFVSEVTGERVELTADESARIRNSGDIEHVDARLQFTQLPLRPDAVPAGARPVAIADASFEQTPCKDLQSAIPTVWQCEPANFVGVFDPTDAQFPGTTGDGGNVRRVLPAGGQLGVVQGGGPFQDEYGDTSLRQELSAEVVPDAEYTLMFYVGARADYPKMVPDYKVELLAGEQTIMEQINPVVPAPGEFRLVRLEGVAPGDAHGKLRLRFSDQGVSESQSFIDDVRLFVRSSKESESINP